MKIEFHNHGKKFFVNVMQRKFMGKALGLMFRTRNTSNMLFSFKKDSYVSLHSWFVFFPFLCIWLDERMNVVDKRIVMPFSTLILPSKKFRHVIELPFNDGNEEIIRNLVGVAKV